MSTLSRFASTATAEDWALNLSALRQRARDDALDSADVRRVVDEAGAAARRLAVASSAEIRRAASRRGEALNGAIRAAATGVPPVDESVRATRNWLALAWVLDPRVALQRLRMDGLLRASTWRWRTEIPELLLAEMLYLSRALHPSGDKGNYTASRDDLDALAALCQTDRTYLASLRTLWRLAPTLQRIEATQLDALRRERQQGIFGLLATVEVVYANQGPPPAWRGRWPSGLATGVDDGTGEIAVALAEAATYAVRRYSQAHGRIAMDPRRRPADSTLAEKGIYLTRLASWALLTRAREWEELVDVHAYRAVATSKRAIVIEPSSERYEQSIRFSFLHAAQQNALSALAVQSDAMTLVDFTRKFLRDFPHLLRAVRQEHPFPRYVIGFAAYDHILPLLRTMGVFAEEAAMLDSIMAEHALFPHEIRTFEIASGVTLWDLILVQRLFRLMNVTVREAIKEDARRALPAVVYSMLPTFSRAKLSDLLRATVGKDPSGLIAFLTANELDGRFDLHYQPLVALSDDGFVLCSFVLGHAQLIRNAWQASQRRAHVGNTPDRAELALVDMFRQAGGDASANVKVSYQGHVGDIDVLACLDGVVVAIEFKRALFPGSVRELRGSLEPMQKAAAQLDRLADTWLQPDFRRTLAEKLATGGWSPTGLAAIREGGQLTTAIVLSNRMFSGWRERGHAVRGINELLSFLLKGTLTLRVPDVIADRAKVPREFTVRTWRGARVSGEDLRRYLAEDVIHDVIMRSMLPITREVDVGATRVIESTFALELLTLGARLEEQFGGAAAR